MGKKFKRIHAVVFRRVAVTTTIYSRHFERTCVYFDGKTRYSAQNDKYRAIWYVLQKLSSISLGKNTSSTRDSCVGRAYIWLITIWKYNKEYGYIFKKFLYKNAWTNRQFNCWNREIKFVLPRTEILFLFNMRDLHKNCSSSTRKICRI